MGRFISEDPIGFGGGDLGLYRYVLNNPLKYLDLSGLKVEIVGNQRCLVCFVGDNQDEVRTCTTIENIPNVNNPRPIDDEDRMQDFEIEQINEDRERVHCILNPSSPGCGGENEGSPFSSELPADAMR